MFGLLLPSRPLQCPNCLSRVTEERRMLADDSVCLHPWHGELESTPSPTGHTCVGTYKTFSAAHCPYCRASGKPDSLENYSVLSVPE